jgi:hypothetical protein
MGKWGNGEESGIRGRGGEECEVGSVKWMEENGDLWWSCEWVFESDR